MIIDTSDLDMKLQKKTQKLEFAQDTVEKTKKTIITLERRATRIVAPESGYSSSSSSSSDCNEEAEILADTVEEVADIALGALVQDISEEGKMAMENWENEEQKEEQPEGVEQVDEQTEGQLPADIGRRVKRKVRRRKR